MGMAQARASGQGQALLDEPLRALVAMIREVFVRHLSAEEALILPILEEDLPLGPQRAQRLCAEHAQQRAELETLCSWPQDEDDRELTRRFQALSAALLDDIAHEEANLLTPEIIRDDGIVIDQVGG
jgi:hypothetical protein